MSTYNEKIDDLLNIREDIRDAVPPPKHRDWNITPNPALRLLIIELDSTVNEVSRTAGILDRKTDTALIKGERKYDALADYLERHNFDVERRPESTE